MNLRRVVRSCVSFYGMYAAAAIGVSFMCGLIMFMYRMKSPAVVAVIVVVTFWVKVAMMVVLRLTVKRNSWRQFYYYKNVGVPVRWLWGITLVFDFQVFVTILFIAKHMT